ncbi:Glycosyl hydrolases family 8 [Paenibacillus sp. yr247]|uniref:glycosyl hydrolase family 8 n=1 Tax=Paenibacillus sp. yr247 TaxID=1761880 RepID=UPI00088E988B|nr:glycosyl hydrolase family 8 [Paenibacillus sp. yr247]SDN69473.1 Glycosyl hydrolases family 8 [Paenibacillus sp. yr247]
MNIKNWQSFLGFRARAIKAKKPFPQHTKYKAGTIKPNHVDQAQLDQAVKDLYDSWKSSYLIQNPTNQDQYYVYYNLEGQDIYKSRSISTSESHGHGMLLTAFMAGYDPNAQSYYEGLFRFYKAHPSSNNPLLMAWKQNKDENGNIINAEGSESATDGDMDIAYSLLLAHNQWGNKGTIDYLTEAKKIIHAILTNDVNQEEWFLKLGDWVKKDTTPKYYPGTRPSDFMTEHMKAFQITTGNSKWTWVVNKTYAITKQLFHGYSANTGLLPDFAVKRNSKFAPAPPDFLEGPYDGDYYMNACRTTWRIPLDYILTGDRRAVPQFTKVNSWIKKKTNGDPGKIRAGYYLNGDDLPLAFNNHLAFVSPFAVSAMIHSRNQEWLNKLWTHMKNSSFENSDYYGNSIKLLCMLVASGNWWFPKP